MDKEAMYKLSYGLFVLTARDGDKDNGFISNTVIQVAFSPDRIGVCANKGSFTHDMIMRTGEFTASIISQDADFDLFEHFGFQSGRDVNKFADFSECARGANGIYYITKGTNAYISVKVAQTTDLGSHTMFVGVITDMKVLSDKPSATYEYYMNNIKPKPSVTEPINKNTNKTEETEMTKWKCPVCGYIHEGPEAPEECPVCHVRDAVWKNLDENAQLAAEHELGIYGKTVRYNTNVSEEDKKYILEQLLKNYKCECSEVGMYLCMARIAHREGYPEIGMYLEKSAYEKAEHAGKFAEFLGEDLDPLIKETTKDNLKWRVDCEFKATQSKFDLAHLCKKYDLDALHDSIHEMSRDEARYCKAFDGMLKRYFK